ncbi:MAG: tRNA (guanosine(37)-N1)-methyltransferase TrmD [Burkholderiales bacterium]|nr:MAG: tRNA (guanosine(37)-N1)-methyltransferase TrmD [Burkholderiales bacterium]
MRFDVLTIFPDMFAALTQFGVSGRAAQRGLYRLETWNPRDFADDAYRSIDDRPYGGGPGMVMMPAPLASTLRAIADVQRDELGARGPVVALSPQGRRLEQEDLRRWAGLPALTLLCGRYEGIDERILRRHVDQEVSGGDIVVSGGELPAMTIVDGIVRWLPGALNDSESAPADSFVDGLLDCPHYTRPERFEGEPVPEVLLSGHHERIARWRRRQALEATARKRPDLRARARASGRLTQADEDMLAELGL